MCPKLSDMLPATPEETNPKRVRFEGIIADARRLGVDRTHLYRVLTGKRESKELLKRYISLKAKRSKKGRS